jgi:hypothetical protein
MAQLSLKYCMYLQTLISVQKTLHILKITLTYTHSHNKGTSHSLVCMTLHYEDEYSFLILLFKSYNDFRNVLFYNRISPNSKFP